MDIRSVAIMGAGHGGLAAAVDLTRRGLEVRLHARREESLAPIRAQGGILAKGVQTGLIPVHLMTTDVADAVHGADLVMLVVPSVAHGFYAQALA
ncbi:MAG: NAD(P)-binding domain-containing protein, partial [Proteobacteria bacterium]|nr:NAD(P)-binding domain-containing protein [Pseudomonadota bacterium]